MNSRRNEVSGLTLMEVMIGVVVLAVALMPVLVLTTTTARRTFSMEHHLVAVQFAAGLMDRYLAMGFDECRRAVAGEVFPRKLLDHDIMRSVTAPETGTAGGGGSGALTKTIQGFQYAVTIEEPAATADREQMYTLVVAVSWPSPGSPRPDRNHVLQAVKFHERP